MSNCRDSLTICENELSNLQTQLDITTAQRDARAASEQKWMTIGIIFIIALIVILGVGITGLLRGNMNIMKKSQIDPEALSKTLLTPATPAR